MPTIGMSATYSGQTVAVWGTNGEYTGIASQEPTKFTRSRSTRRESNSQDVVDNEGDVCGRVRSAHRTTISTTITPTGTSKALAIANANKYMLLTPGARIQLTGDRITALTGRQSGYFELVSVSFEEDQTSIASIQMELEAFDAYDITAPVTT